MSIENLSPTRLFSRDAFAPAGGYVPSQNRQTQTPALSQNQLSMAAESYRAQSMYLEYSSKDGDKVTLRYESVEYQKLTMAASAEKGSDEWQQIVKDTKDQFMMLQKQLVNSFVRSTGGAVPEDQSVGSIEAAPVPEYWNAENTSQRIIDFATSFFSAFDGAGEDFLATIKGAIEEGFSQAREMIGDVPDSVSKLTNDTHDLVMSKLNDWAKANGISTDVGDAVAAAA